MKNDNQDKLNSTAKLPQEGGTTSLPLPSRFAALRIEAKSCALKSARKLMLEAMQTQITRRVLVGLAITQAGIILYAFRGSELRGDEYTYVAAAQTLADVIASSGVDTFKAFEAIVGTGWFMPGMALIGAPLFAAFPDAPNWLIFAWMGLVNGTLFTGLLVALRPVLGRRSRSLLLLFPLLAPLWVAGALSFLPDLPAGLLATIAMALAWRISCAMLADKDVSLSLLAAFEACLIVALYLRGPTIAVALVLHSILFAIALSRRVNRLRAAVWIAAGFATFSAALAPWSIAVSSHFDHPVLTTTNFPLVLADGFGDPEKTCFGPCGPGYDIIPAARFAEQRAAETGANALAIQREMMEASLEGMDLRSYFAQVREHFGRFLLDPGGRLRARLDKSFAIPEDVRGEVYLVALVPTLALYIPSLLALLIANLVVIRSSDGLALQAVLIKGVTACLFLQPFFHKSSGRYWIAFAAIATWAAVLLWAAWLERRQTLPKRAMPRWLDAMQAIYTVGFTLLGTAILLA